MTADILILYGHGAVLEETFDFKRSEKSKITIYSYTREGVAVWDRQIKSGAELAIKEGKVHNYFSNQNTSRIGGVLFKNYVIQPPGKLAFPDIPVGYGTTQISSLNAEVKHDNSDLAKSKIMILKLNRGEKKLSDIISDAKFKNRSLWIIWCACKGNL
jgi:hypothetical protein